jgi:hypothetical protein
MTKERNFAMCSLTSLVEEGKKVAFIAGNRQLDYSNKKQKIESFEKFGCNIVPLIYVDGAKAASDGCSLVDALSGASIHEDEVPNYIVIVEGQHRFAAAMSMDKQPEILLLKDYTGCDTKQLLAEANIVATPWKSDNFISGAALFQPENQLANFANDLALRGYSTSTISKILCLAGGKLTKRTFADIMSGKDVTVEGLDYERATRFLTAARSKFDDKFISKRYLIDVVIDLQSIRGAEAVIDAIHLLPANKVKEIDQAKAAEKSSLLRLALKALIPAKD